MGLFGEKQQKKGPTAGSNNFRSFLKQQKQQAVKEEETGLVPQ
jgi:hypothetical protein